MFDAQKLMQRLYKVREAALSNALTPISAPTSVEYEFGRRVGVKQGMDILIDNALKFFTEDEKEEKDSKL